MSFWSKKPDIEALEKSRDVRGLLDALQGMTIKGDDPEIGTRIIQGLVRIMRREGHSSHSTYNEGAAKALLSLGIWRELVAFHDEYAPPAELPDACGVFVVELESLLGDFALQTSNQDLSKHLLMTLGFGAFAFKGDAFGFGARQLVRELTSLLERAGATQDLAEISIRAKAPAAKQAAIEALSRLGASAALDKVVSGDFAFDQVLDDFLARQKYQALVPSSLSDPALEALLRFGNGQALELLQQIGDHGLQEALLKSGRGEMLRRYNERPTRGDDHLDRRIQKYVRRLLHESKHTVVAR